MIDDVDAYAPGFRSSVIARQILSPLDLEREFGLIGGDIFHGASASTSSIRRGRCRTRRLPLAHSGLLHVRRLDPSRRRRHRRPGHNAAREMIRDFRARDGGGGSQAVAAAFTERRWRLIDALAASALTRRRSGDPGEGSAPTHRVVRRRLGLLASRRARPGSPGTPGWVSPGSSGSFGSELSSAATAAPCGRDRNIGVRGWRRIKERLAGSTGAVGGSPGSTPAGGWPDCVGVPESEPGGVAGSSGAKSARPSFMSAPVAKSPAPTPISAGENGSGNEPRGGRSRPDNEKAVASVP